MTNEEEGVPGTALREISILSELDSPYVEKIYQVIHANNALYLIFEYCEMDLRKFLDKAVPNSSLV